jgi:hypothetical protein
MTNLYDVLEICLQDIEQGADVDTVLFRYPEFADELRPILEVSVKARSIVIPEPPADVVRRGRAKVLQHAAELREAKVARPARRLWTVPLRRALVSLAVIAALFISSTGLVQAASTTLPGDNLYPVKRTWEDVRLLFTFDELAREALEVEHENERLDELYEVFAEGRSVKVDFAGLVTRQNGDLWLVSTVPVLISPQTDIRAAVVVTGDAVRVRGITQVDGTVLAERVDVLPAGVPLPEVEDDDHGTGVELENSGNESSNENETREDNSGNESETDTPETEKTETPDNESDKDKTSLEGVVNSINGSILIINGLPMDISNAEIKGTASVGATVKVEGYYDENGIFIVTKIEFENGGSDSGDDSNDDNSDDNDSNDDTNDDKSNDNNDDKDSNSNDDNSNGGDD